MKKLTCGEKSLITFSSGEKAFKCARHRM